MPVIYVHGVNVRKDTQGDYERKEAARNELLRRIVLKPLAAKAENPKIAQMEIVSPYWGGFGVQFGWGHQSVPATGLQHLGPDDAMTPQSDFEFAVMVRELAHAEPGTLLQSLGADDGDLKRAAHRDLPRFLEAVFLPIILGEQGLPMDVVAENWTALGLSEALLLMASREVGQDATTQAAVGVASSDDEVMDLLEERVLEQYEVLQQAARQAPSTPIPGSLEPLGSQWLDRLREGVGELFTRARNAPQRAATLGLLGAYRRPIHENLTRFVGDVCVYLIQRERQQPGLIGQSVVDAIRSAARRHPDEPLIVLTHSMGGNIVYDVLTTFAKEVKVDAWVSVGGQVGMFEEMKIFAASNGLLVAPQQVRGLKPRVRYWLNVYDPADILSFLVKPVFAEADEDLLFRTGESAIKAHGEYFNRPAFYEALRDRLLQRLP